MAGEINHEGLEEHQEFVVAVPLGERPLQDMQLDFRAPFYLYRSVPPDNQVTSLTGVGRSAGSIPCSSRSGMIRASKNSWLKQPSRFRFSSGIIS